MAVFKIILLTICMALAVSGARIQSYRPESTKTSRAELEPFEDPPCEDHTVGKPIFHENPSKLWICIARNTPLEMVCEEGSGFNGEECVTWDKHPCRNGQQPPVCEGPAITRPHQHLDPGKFWICQGGEPTEYVCPAGHGFMDAPGDLGCIPWARWRCMGSEKH